MLHPHHVPHLERLSPFYGSPMLMLGSTGSRIDGYGTARDYFGQWVDDYHDLDLDGGDLCYDLNMDLPARDTFETVINFGTIEHVWNVHNAWANALRAVCLGGHFITHSPVCGWNGHGLHMTFAPSIRAFVSKNGFEIVEDFTTRWPEEGTPRAEFLWMAARKTRHIEFLEDFEPAWQVYEQGKKKAVC